MSEKSADCNNILEVQIIEESKYTPEEKIVSAVWVHERSKNQQTWTDIENNFRVRFGSSPPSRTTFLKWERRLFSEGSIEEKEKTGRPISRLMHVPYVKASLEEDPDLSLRERAQALGLPRTTLLHILREDLNMEFEVQEEYRNKRHGNRKGKWKKRNEEDWTKVDGECSTIVVVDDDDDVEDEEMDQK